MPLVQEPFGDIITFTRASTGTYFNSAGVLTSASNNVPRFDFDPVTLAARGLLIEEQRTNFFTNASGAMSGSIGTGSVSGPDNVNCRTFIPTAGAVSFPNVTGPVQSFTLSLGQTVDWAWSGWFAAGPVGSFILEPRLIFSVSVNNATSFVYAELQINTTNWTVRQKSLSAGLTEVSAPTITLFKTGLYRVTWVVRYTQDATGRNNVSASFQARNTSNSGTYTADGVSGVQYALLQAETGSFPTSYIPTTTIQATRSADVASVNTLSPWYNATEGTLFAEVTVPQLGRSARLVVIDAGSTTDMIDTTVTGANAFAIEAVAGGVYGGSSLTANTITANAIQKTAATYSTGSNETACLNGGTVASANVTLPSVSLTTMRLGGQSNFAATLNGYLRRITYYPRKLSSAELQAITA